MWLLPDEEGTCVGGRFACPRVGHLHPANALESLTLGNLLRYGISHLVIPVEHGGYHLRTVPQSKVNHVPPCHFQMRTPEPRIIGQSCFLWGTSVGAVHLGEILRKHYAALQLLGTRIGAVREVNNGTFLPPAVPCLEHRLECLVEDESSLSRIFPDWRETVFCLKCQHVGSGRKFEVMAVTFLQLCFALPAQCEIVVGRVKRMLNGGRMLICKNDFRGVTFGLCKVCCGIGMLSCRVGQADAHCGTPVFQ